MKVRSWVVAAVVSAAPFLGMPAAEAHTSVRLAAGGTYTGVIANGLTVVYDCTAAGVGDIVSVAITRCQITTSPENSRVALPGPAATVAGVTTVPLAPFRLCYAAVFTFVDAHTRTVEGCNPLALNTGIPQLVGAGVTTA